MIKTGTSFNSFLEMETMVKDIEAKYHTLLSIRNSKKTKSDKINQKLFPYMFVKYICFRSDNGHASKSQGKRPRRSSFSINCPFFILITYDQKLECYVIKKVNTNHSFHKPSPEEIELHPRKRCLNHDEQAEYIEKDMFMLKAKKADISRLIRETYGKKRTTKDLYNNGVLFQKKANNGMVIECLFYQSTALQSLYKKYGSVILIDGTYKLLQCGYVKVNILVVDNSKKSRVFSLGTYSI